MKGILIFYSLDGHTYAVAFSYNRAHLVYPVLSAWADREDMSFDEYDCDLMMSKLYEMVIDYHHSDDRNDDHLSR